MSKKKKKGKPYWITEAWEHPNSTIKYQLLTDFSGNSKMGGDYVKHTAEEVTITEKEVLFESTPNASFIDGQEVNVSWNQMAIDTRKKRLINGQTIKGLKNAHDVVRDLLRGKYICLKCHRLLSMKVTNCYKCDSITTYMAIPGKVEISETSSYKIPKALKYVYDLIEMPIAQLQELPGTRLKSCGTKLPGVNAYRKEIDELRKPLTDILNDFYGPLYYFEYLERDPGRRSSSYKFYLGRNGRCYPFYTVVTSYLERLKLIRLQLWNLLYSILGGLGDFIDIKKITIDDKGKYNYIKLKTPIEAIGYYPYIGKHELSNNSLLILSKTKDLTIGTVKDIESVKIGRKDKLGKYIQLSKKNPLYNPLKEAESALVFQNNNYISIIPQERSFIFPRNLKELINLFEYMQTEINGSNKHLKPSLREWDLDEIEDDI